MSEEESWERLFESQCGATFTSCLQPVSTTDAAGFNLRGTAVYREIREAREAEDPSLPQGPWERVMKRADWAKVRQLVLRQLQAESKDLQLTVWLLEAQVKSYGFAGIAPVLWLITKLCDIYGEELHPKVINGDNELRNNVLESINKLAPVLRLIPLVRGSQLELTWSDYLRAQRAEQLIASGVQPTDVEGPTLAECRTALTTASSAEITDLCRDVGASVHSLALCKQVLERVSVDGAPGLGAFGAVLREVNEFVTAELTRRGVTLHDVEVSTFTPSTNAPVLPEVPVSSALAIDNAGERRAAAYAQLGQIADLLQRIDPHSPTPYLIRRAVAWGELGTAQLYQELFVRCQGQLNIFELMGIEVSK